jgi:long-chain acyl-CoA synthetase
VNTMYNALLNDPAFATLDFSKLVLSTRGGMAVQQAVAQRWQAATGVPIVEGYGLSETSPCATTNPPTATSFNGTVGLPLPSTEVSIRADAGNEGPLAQPGEICIRGPQVMAGYWNCPDETARAMTPDGFFRSGDVGLMDEAGFVRIVDRKKDMIGLTQPRAVTRRVGVAADRFQTGLDGNTCLSVLHSRCAQMESGAFTTELI